MKAALANGNNFWNAGEFYGTEDYNSLHLLNSYFTKYPEDAEKVVLSIKGGLKNMSPDGSPENVQRSVENCLKLLDGKKSIDIFEMARVDHNIPLEVTLEELEKYVTAGKIGGIALSEVGAATIKKAVKITKIVAVEVEVSLWATDIFTNGVAAACAENNLLVVAYSPIGRGILSGEIKSYNDIPEGDFRRFLPRFQPGAFETNLELVKELEKIAKQKNCSSAQLAISWVKAQSEKDGNPVIVPIPGATTEKRVEENSKDIILSNSDLSEIDSILGKFEVVGGRYGGPQAAHMEG
jgi:pyridoxine 4-dehydrogenase